ncbi:Rha family transcriptional regulator, partial [Anaerotruncus colihominis]|uniref:Rha family transcriptional regulator n=1 Tax=Anaerotruncus colihominis TaxID=169435 RepID=UPI0034A5BF30
MADLVFLEPNKLGSEPFTTSKVIAEFAGIGHKKLKSSIAKHKEGLEAFGILAPYEASIPKRGRGQPEVIYKLNEQQAYFLMTLLK